MYETTSARALSITVWLGEPWRSRFAGWMLLMRDPALGCGDAWTIRWISLSGCSTMRAILRRIRSTMPFVPACTGSTASGRRLDDLVLRDQSRTRTSTVTWEQRLARRSCSREESMFTPAETSAPRAGATQKGLWVRAHTEAVGCGPHGRAQGSIPFEKLGMPPA